MNLNFSQFIRPQRYIGNEHNAIIKNHSAKTTICLAYPADYDVGMSNLGLRISYGLLNQDPQIACERVFLPGQDLSMYLRQNNQPLFSLETKTPLNQFEIIGFNLSCETNCLNMLEMLDLSQIAIFADQRQNIIVLANGMANPQPFVDFVDVFFIGEIEDVASDFIQAITSNRSKPSRLQALAKIPGFYVPSLYQPGTNITRVFTKNLDTAYFPVRWLTPYTQITHDRVALEIARGCPNQCAFCQARGVYYPYRIRKPETILQLIKETYQHTGYENYSLLSLSTSDYPNIDQLLDQALEFMRPRRIGLSLPSLRVDDLLGDLQSKISLLKKTNLTVAVEAASLRLRESMRKNIDLEKLFTAAKIMRSINIHRIKLYLMFGFNDETQQDLEQIPQMLNRLRQESRLAINVSINVFIPKPFSAWQNSAMPQENILDQKRAFLVNALRQVRGVDSTISHPGQSLLEGVLSRGDQALGRIIYDAWQLQRETDRYDKDIPWPEWKALCLKHKLDYTKYLDQQANPHWDFIKPQQLT